MENQKAKGKTYLQVVGIIFIVFGGFGLLGSLFTLFMSNNDVVGEALKQTGLTTTQMTISVLAAIVELIAGIIGVMYCNRPEKMNIPFALGGILIVFQIVDSAMAATKGFGGTAIFSLILGLILPVLYLVGAYLNKKVGFGEDALDEED